MHRRLPKRNYPPDQSKSSMFKYVYPALGRRPSGKGPLSGHNVEDESKYIKQKGYSTNIVNQIAVYPNMRASPTRGSEI